MIKGQCLCGAVQYQYHAEIENSILCYCQHCQQAQGAFAGWNSPLDQSKFEFEKGRDQLKEYFHTPNKARVFCQQCGSPIYSYRTDLPNVIRLRLGTVTEGHIPAPTEEFFTEHKPKFIEVR
ncbi:GFA family protein [Acinetobacter haemolyticus]|uniref:GFA family protein n=1 Tax=Acinetobacter haemolyticus TaxID=29430 RepID=A0A857IW71_ACIHA|nr:GFA family protein [Acinetobacter haemolyticus]ENW20651.1 hypothetical protein F926_01420 [Acinetobacter haemolyticus NIPH 261]MCU4387791.1 GFA family protein [Acinetobacter haemolyticus]NAR85059.1 GFA family protein [Acinetobacter haemolyticus]NAS03647.1 GFA family protein [Acinetobacter haemolyticus]NAS05728.1 GFA family protein [Acinetobacter haemolyticus]